RRLALTKADPVWRFTSESRKARSLLLYPLKHCVTHHRLVALPPRRQKLDKAHLDLVVHPPSFEVNDGLNSRRNSGQPQSCEGTPRVLGNNSVFSACEYVRVQELQSETFHPG